MNDNGSSFSSDKDSSSREDSKSPLAMKLTEKDGESFYQNVSRCRLQSHTMWNESFLVFLVNSDLAFQAAV